MFLRARSLLSAVAKGEKFNPKGEKFNPKGEKFNPKGEKFNPKSDAKKIYRSLLNVRNSIRKVMLNLLTIHP